MVFPTWTNASFCFAFLLATRRERLKIRSQVASRKVFHFSGSLEDLNRESGAPLALTRPARAITAGERRRPKEDDGAARAHALFADDSIAFSLLLLGTTAATAAALGAAACADRVLEAAALAGAMEGRKTVDARLIVWTAKAKVSSRQRGEGGRREKKKKGKK